MMGGRVLKLGGASLRLVALPAAWGRRMMPGQSCQVRLLTGRPGLPPTGAGSHGGDSVVDSAQHLSKQSREGPHLWVHVKEGWHPVKIRIDSVIDVYDLLEQVKAEETLMLDKVPTSNLQLMESMYTTDKVFRPGQPLAELGDAGRTFDTALFVTYPDAAVSQADVEFAKALDAAVKEGNFLKTAAGSFKRSKDTEVWNEHMFYLRDCYEPIVDLMFERGWPPSMALQGSSGIGLSNMLIYLMWRRWQDPDLSKFPVFVHKRKSITKFQKGKEPCEVNKAELRRAGIGSLYVMDSDIDFPASSQFPALWITSGRWSEIQQYSNHFKHARNAKGMIYMPPWSLEEMLKLEVMELHGISKETVEERFNRFGGTARLVLRSDGDVAKRDTDTLERTLTSPDALRALEVPYNLKAISPTTHLLVKLHPVADSQYRRFYAELASPYIQQQLVMQNRKALWECIRDGSSPRIARAMFEETWRRFVQDKSIKDFSMNARRLSDGHEQIVQFRGALEGCSAQGDPSADVREGTYYMPDSKTFTAVDGWSSQGFFQVTMADAHDIQLGSTRSQIGKVLRALYESKNEKVPFYFVVPITQFYEYNSEQKVTGDSGDEAELCSKIEQWVVCFQEKLPLCK